jgi:acyl-coenzyme A synthetase/AMP-(fatty) acid ligase
MARPHRTHYRRVLDYVALHARRRPDNVAVLANGQPITYKMLYRDFSAMMTALADFGVPRGGLAAIGLTDFYIQMLLVFGFEALGVTTGSFRAMQAETCYGLTGAADITLTDNPAVPGRRVFAITEDWVRAALRRLPNPDLAVGPAPAEEVAVVIRSSGTTGQPKRMLLTHRMVAIRLAVWREMNLCVDLNARARFLATMHFATGLVHIRIGNCLRLGATIITETVRDLPTTLLATRPTHFTVLPLQLGTMLNALPPRSAPGPLLPTLQVHTMGAKLPDDLRRRALRDLCGTVVETYGANEASGVCRFDGDGPGRINRFVEVEIAGKDGRALPIGETGRIRLRGEGVVRGYVDDDRATAEMFQDGWYYPGDFGRLVAPGMLRLEGRPGDVLNIAGVKLNAADLESRVQALAGVRDAALVQHRDTADPLVHVCVAFAPAVDLGQMTGAIERLFDFRVAVRQVTSIPRSDQGKIRRDALRQTLFGAPAPAADPLLAPVP